MAKDVKTLFEKTSDICKFQDHILFVRL